MNLRLMAGNLTEICHAQTHTLLNLDQTLFRNCCDFKKCYPIFIFDDLSWGSSLIDSVKLTGYYICCKY